MRIYLIGLPSSGKTTLGLRLKDELNLQYIDMDKYIEDKYNKDIPTIFKEYGETYFRLLEKLALKDFLLKDNLIISTGGGVIKDKTNKDLMDGEIIYLSVDLEELNERIKKQVDNERPLLKTKSIYELYAERKELYEYFKTIEIENHDIDTSIKQIKEYLNK